MATNRAAEVPYDAEAALRLLEHELDERRGAGDGTTPAGPAVASTREAAADPTGALAQVPMILLRASREIAHVLESLRQCRAQLESVTADGLQITHEKLREVTSATEVAATDILDGLDRAQALVDALDAEAEEAGNRSEKEKALRNRLRDEVFTITGCLQFQDITTQQLAHASTVLTEMEARLGDVARLFDPSRCGAPERPAATRGQGAAFSPDAAFRQTGSRQAVADEVFARGTTE